MEYVVPCFTSLWTILKTLMLTGDRNPYVSIKKQGLEVLEGEAQDARRE